MVIRLDIETWVIIKMALKGRGRKRGLVGEGRRMRAVGFCGPHVCLDVFLLF
jgi:hypothetical protein